MADPMEQGTNARSIKKLPPIPKGSKVQKRPLTRRQPPSSSKSRIIYLSSRTPFMAAVKRVRKQLDQGLVRASPAPKAANLQSRVSALEKRDGSSLAVGGATVTVMGTGKAVEKVLAVAGWFEQQGDCDVEVRTKTVGTVDDVVDEEGEGEDESRLRRLSCLEVAIRLK